MRISDLCSDVCSSDLMLRIHSVSPGIISTPMGHLEAQHAPAMAAMRRISPIQRIGQPEDIASAAEFLLGPNASFITGIDLPVDGGVIAAQLFGSERDRKRTRLNSSH